MHNNKANKAQIGAPAGRTPTAPQEYPAEIAVSPAEAARRCGIGRTFLYAALNSGALKSVKISSRRLITLVAIQDWLGAHEQRPASKQGRRRAA